MNTLFFIIWGLSLISIVVFIALAALQLVKKDKAAGKKQLRNGGISAVVMIASFAIFISTTESSETEDKKEKEGELVATTANVDEVEKEAEEPKETKEERDARYKKEIEEKAIAEQKTKEEAAARAKVEQEEKERQEKLANEVPVWKSKIDEIATTNDSPTDKYDAVMLYAKDYSVTEDEIKEFEKYIITEYQNKNYIADINNAEYMLSNIFRANVITSFYGKTTSPINDFAFDFYQNTKYTYRGADAPDSDAVKANEAQMDKALIKMQ
ncbi:hypothetical protein [Solibacillus cecembensis]|uniref:hypothetical protein n=1 Tax=Solibacillus cecembensis TaxID=459347 RepID=UPI003D064589